MTMSIITDNPVWSIILVVTFLGGALWTYRLWQWFKMLKKVPNKGLHGKPTSNEVSRDLANSELARLREIGGNGSHKKTA